MNKRPTLAALEDRGDFIGRHIGPDERDLAVMLAALDVSSLDELIAQTVPADLLGTASLNLPPPRSERVVDDALRRMFARNELHTSLIGMGYHDTITPNVIKRNVLENPGWYTAYTPYQAEISQGRLEALLNFQQMVIDLTGLPVANASLLDEATAAAEAMTMAHRISKVKSPRFIVDADTHPQTLAVVRTRAEPLGIEVVECDPWAGIEGEYFGVLVSYPGSSGRLRDPAPVLAAARTVGALSAVAADPLGLVLLKEPGTMGPDGIGADIVFGSAQRFGVPMGYGGPHAAFFACRDEHKRQMPGRIIGVSTDALGKPALRMALQTREQHIRREKANSNICTAQVLLAVIAAFYAVYHGPRGLRTIASRVHRMAIIFAQGLRDLGFDVVHESFFDTVQVRVPGIARRIAARARAAGFNLHVIDADHLSAAFDETSRRSELKQLLAVFATRAETMLDITQIDAAVPDCIPANLQRESDFLTHPVFNRYHSETEMMRYLRRLASRDIALDRAMIPLGSCTMKLNATTEMVPVTYRLFAALHPFVPLEQAQGYQQLFEELEEQLCEITGFAAMSFQPNAGSQGEYAGLLVIRKYHRTRGEDHRNVCLIPASAHGTNPASAVLAGMEVVVVACDALGNIDAGRPQGEGRAACRPSGRADDDLPVHARRVRRGRARHLRADPRARRSGLHGWRQHECHGGSGAAGRHRLRRVPPESAQDLLHSARRRRARHGPDRRGTASRALPAGSPGGAGRESGGRPGRHHRCGIGRALGFGQHPAHRVGLHRADGRRRPAPRDHGGDPERQLHRTPAGTALPDPLHRQAPARGARVHHRPARHQGRVRHHGGRRRQAADGLRLPCADSVLSRCRAP
jgi:glycine dehydrogenase